jgi:hypothetical protein
MPQQTMKAAVIRAPGGPEVLTLEDWPIPDPTAGWVLIRVKPGRVFRPVEIVEAHHCMEDNAAGGKIVVLT